MQIFLLLLCDDLFWLQIEILGVSLPWRGIFTNEGPGTRLIERVKKFQGDTNPFLSGSDINPSNSSSAKNLSPPAQSSTSADLFIDLLTGQEPLPHPLAQPVTENVVYKESDTLDFLDQAVFEYQNVKSNHNISSSKDACSDTSAERYLSCLKSLMGPCLVCCYIIYVAHSSSKFCCFTHSI